MNNKKKLNLKSALFRVIRKITLVIINNIISNNILILIRKDHLIKNWVYNWNTWSFDNNKSNNENVGFSTHPQIQKLVSASHKHLQSFVSSNLKSGDYILDLGCGPGLFLKDFESHFHLYGIDMSTSFIEKAKDFVPKATFVKANFLNYQFEPKFELIYSFSVFQYIEVSKIDQFFEKLSSCLKKNGLFYMQYPHAVRWKDQFYPDLSYIKYSPKFVEKIASKYFNIITHEHYFDGKKVGKFDKTPYSHPTDSKRNDTIQNMYLLIAQKA